MNTLILLMTLILNTAQIKTENYPLTTVITCVDYESDVVIAMDFNGNMWEFEGCNDWIEGDVCSMIMNNRGTDVIYDDVIIDMKYCGWVEQWGFNRDTNDYIIYFDYE